jgi:hypothetical protein
LLAALANACGPDWDALLQTDGSELDAGTESIDDVAPRRAEAECDRLIRDVPGDAASTRDASADAAVAADKAR